MVDPSTQTPERRSSVRIDAEIRVFYGTGISKLLTGYTVDLTPNGAFLVTTCPFDIGDSLELKLFVPEQNETIISCMARVAWVNHESTPPKPEFPTGIGLQFVDLTSGDKKIIEGFLKSKQNNT